MNRASAISEIKKVFAQYKSIGPQDDKLVQALTDGKLYELYVLSRVVEELRARGFGLQFRGTTLKFKASPGKIKVSDPHFELAAPDGRTLWLFVDIEFETFGSKQPTGGNDQSRRHEVDIVVVTVNGGYPSYDQIAFGVECKAVAKFTKSIVKEVLGVRRELSLLTDVQQSTLTQCGGSPPVGVRANPPSEYWLAYTDIAGDQYKSSPSAFSIEFLHWQP
jgi:hypothetical protein